MDNDPSIIRVYFFIYAFDRNISKRRVSSSSLIERWKGFEGSLHDGVRTVPYRGNGNCRGGRLSASSRPSLIAVLSFGSTASSSLIQLSVIRRHGICPVAELEIQFHRICAVPLIFRGNRLREETPRIRLRVLAKRLDTLKSRDCYKATTRRFFPLCSMARWYKVRFSFLLLKRDFSRLGRFHDRWKDR